MIASKGESRWSVVVLWVLLTILCIPIALVIDFGVMRILGRVIGNYIYVDGVRHITEDYLYMYTLVPIAGFVTGAFQFGVLRRYLPCMGGWVVTTTAGWVIGGCLALVPGWLGWTDPLLTVRLACAVMGLTIGVAQWLILRRRVSRAGWWIAANVVGWGALTLIPGVYMVGPLEVLLLGLVPACTTAAMLVLLMGQVQPTGSLSAKAR